MIDIDKHREDFIKANYDLFKITITLSVLNPFFTEKIDLIGIIIGLTVSLIFLAIAIILREGGKK